MSADFEAQGLMLGDRINWAYILGLGVLKVDEAIGKEEGFQSEQQVREAAILLYDKIPEAWVENDEKWKVDIKKAITRVRVDNRPTYCGLRIGKPKWRYVSTIFPHRLLRACINVFNRRGLLSKTIFSEAMLPEPDDFEKELYDEIEEEED